MRRRTNRWLVGIVLACVIGCLPPKGDPLGFPRIRVHVTGIDDVGGRSTFTIDPHGRFILELRAEARSHCDELAGG